MEIPFEKRPTCQCGEKMKLIEYVGYYDSFRYWSCKECDISDEMENYEPDSIHKGAYA